MCCSIYLMGVYKKCKVHRASAEDETTYYDHHQIIYYRNEVHKHMETKVKHSYITELILILYVR